MFSHSFSIRLQSDGVISELANEKTARIKPVLVQRKEGAQSMLIFNGI